MESHFAQSFEADKFKLEEGENIFLNGKCEAIYRIENKGDIKYVSTIEVSDNMTQRLKTYCVKGKEVKLIEVLDRKCKLPFSLDLESSSLWKSKYDFN